MTLNSKNICDWNINRQINENKCVAFKNERQVSENLVKRIGLEKELEGHTGCVNCLEWSERGDLLASGSDDCQIIFWNPFTYKMLKTFQSGHQGNIFSVKFLPRSESRTVVSGAADCKVRLHDVNANETVMSCGCHTGRVKRLTVAPDVPHLFWSSAEDGLVLQFDIRKPHRCSNQTNNVLINLVNFTGSTAEAKCIAINPLRPELIAVGANDAYVRIYDRRMISPCSKKVMTEPTWVSLQTPDNESQMHFHKAIYEPKPSPEEEAYIRLARMPPNCAKYYIAGHLSKKKNDARKRSRSYATTYVAFSPDGSQLLANLGGEHIYLFDVFKETKPKSFQLNPTNNNNHKNGFNKDISSTSHVHTNGFNLNGISNHTQSSSTSLKQTQLSPIKKNFITSKSPLPCNVESIKSQANDLFEQNEYNKAIHLYNIAISYCPNASVLYGNRAAAVMKRQWDGDYYFALRDCLFALTLDPEYFKVHFRLAKCLHQLRWHEEALECLQELKSKFPTQSQSQLYIKHIVLLENEIRKAITTISSKQETPKKDVKLRTNIELNTERTQSQLTSHDFLLSDSASGVDSSIHVEVDAQSSSSSQSSSPSNPNFNQSRIPRRDFEPIFISQEKEWEAMANDYKSRFIGHCNTTTDIKEANFFGSNGQYIVAGSDDARIYIWDKQTTNLVKVLNGDESIVNVTAPHATSCLLATSGIDPVIRLWSPRPESQNGKKDEREVENIEDASMANQKRMNADPLEVMLMNMGYRIPGVYDNNNDNEDADEPQLQCRQS